MGTYLSLIIEIVVALLLMVTIGYCYVVNRKLMALRADQNGLKSIIKDLDISAQKAERAVQDMQQKSLILSQELGNKINKAEKLSEKLEKDISKTAKSNKVSDAYLARQHSDIFEMDGLDREQSKQSHLSDHQLDTAQNLRAKHLSFNKSVIAQNAVSNHSSHQQAERDLLAMPELVDTEMKQGPTTEIQEPITSATTGPFSGQTKPENTVGDKAQIQQRSLGKIA